MEKAISEGLNSKARKRSFEIGYEAQFDQKYYASPLREAALDALYQGRFHEELTSGPVDWTKCPVRLHWDLECGVTGPEAQFYLTQKEIVKLQKRRYVWLADHDCDHGFIHLSNGKKDPRKLWEDHPSPKAWNGHTVEITVYSKALQKAKLVRKLSRWLRSQGVRVEIGSAVY